MKQKVIIVNKKDEIIGAKYRRELDDNIDIIRVSSIWIENEKGELLLARRSFDKRHDPGKWGPAAAGTLEVGDTYQSNIIQEVEEELGLSLGKESIREIGIAFHNTSHPFFVGNFYACIDSGAKFTLQESEVEDVRWIDWSSFEHDLENFPEKYIGSFGKSPQSIIKQVKKWKNK